MVVEAAAAEDAGVAEAEAVSAEVLEAGAGLEAAEEAREAVVELEEIREDRMMEVDREEMPAAEALSRSSTPTNYGERTVIKMTPFGPRKLTIYDGELAE